MRDKYAPLSPKIFIKKSADIRDETRDKPLKVRLIEGQTLCFIFAFYLSYLCSGPGRKLI